LDRTPERQLDLPSVAILEGPQVIATPSEVLHSVDSTRSTGRRPPWQASDTGTTSVDRRSTVIANANPAGEVRVASSMVPLRRLIACGTARADADCGVRLFRDLMVIDRRWAHFAGALGEM
jgi:hypothetical protein